MSELEMPAHQADDGQVPFDSAETEQEVEISGVETTTGGVAPPPDEIEETRDEHADYGDKVQRRINQLTKRMKDAERERDEATRYAQVVNQEAAQLKTRMQSLDQNYLTEYGGRVSAEQQQAHSQLKRATEMGDSDAMVEAQQKIAQLAVAADRYHQAKATQTQQKQQQPPQQPVYQNQAPPQQQYQPAPAIEAPDEKAEDWAARNSWFGADNEEERTFAAFGIHKRLVEAEGFDPQSNDYYDELDKRMRSAFPQKFDDNRQVSSNRPAQTVAGVSRSRSSGRNRRVKLTPTQVTIAKKLGVPLEEYAKYVKD
tara:strand:- start:2399 stop:3337 length:939 start_codon:yes stop_codon:yes gene_type:complete